MIAPATCKLDMFYDMMILEKEDDVINFNFDGEYKKNISITKSRITREDILHFK